MDKDVRFAKVGVPAKSCAPGGVPSAFEVDVGRKPPTLVGVVPNFPAVPLPRVGDVPLVLRNTSRDKDVKVLQRVADDWNLAGYLNRQTSTGFAGSHIFSDFGRRSIEACQI